MKFADDCVLYDSGKCWLDTHTHLQACLDKYIAWRNEHNLTLNAFKPLSAVILCKNVKMDALVARPLQCGEKQNIIWEEFLLYYKLYFGSRTYAIYDTGM